MKTQIIRAAMLFTVFTLLVFPNRAWSADAKKSLGPDIYDESLDGSQQIADALIVARRQNKRVLLHFGANWCIWCHRLHDLCETNKTISEKLQAGYVVALIDVNNDHNKEVDIKYGHPMRLGLPVMVVLDADGRQLTTKNTEELEEGKGHNADKVLAFLAEWAPGK